MSVRRVCSALLLLLTVTCVGTALALQVDNPDVEGSAWDGDGTHQCLAPWDTVRNRASNTPGGEPPPDAEVIATSCRHAGYGRFDQSYRFGALGAVALVGWIALVLCRRRGTRTTLVAVSLAASAVAGLCWVGWERGHPTAFADNGAEQALESLPVEQAIYVGMSWPGNPSRDVVIETARPMITRDIASSSVEVVHCVPRADAGPIGTVSADRIDDFCADLVTIEWDHPEVRLVSERNDQLLVKLTIYTPGTVAIAGIEVVYRDGWQRGRQEVAGHFTATTRVL